MMSRHFVTYVFIVSISHGDDSHAHVDPHPVRQEHGKE